MRYSWQITKMDTRDQTNGDGDLLSNAVVKIRWRRTGVDGFDNSSTILGYTIMSAEAVSSGDFVDFDTLTEETVIGWLESTITSDQMARYDAKIMEKINKAFTTQRAVPWS